MKQTFPLVSDIDFEKSDGLVPAIIQDADTDKVLMLGYMNRDAYQQTLETSRVTFFSRTKGRLWRSEERRVGKECYS